MVIKARYCFPKHNHIIPIELNADVSKYAISYGTELQFVR